jgi:polyhydroxyalkanoate synthase
MGTRMRPGAALVPANADGAPAPVGASQAEEVRPKSTAAARPVPPGPAPTVVEPRLAPRSLDRLLQSMLGRMTLGVSPASVGLAYFDWALHMALAPGKQQELTEKAMRKTVRFLLHAAQVAREGNAVPPCIEPLPQDRRFLDPEWRQAPFSLMYQWFLLGQQWLHNATNEVSGVSHHHEQVVSFLGRQVLDAVSPSNFIATNPVLLRRTMETGGANLAQGFFNWLQDWERAIAGRPAAGSEAYSPGREVAVTPGEVIYRNKLMELIQYKPTTEQVQAEPILILPAWIMKYYILDLSPHNSLVKYLVDRGHTVFMISWHNPGVDDRELAIADYLQLGPLEAQRVISAIMPGRKVNAVGYCLGGTLLAITAALLSRNGENPFGSMTLLAAQTDFTEAGELTLFIDESQLTYLENLMWDQGYLDTRQMAGAFQLLRSNDLIWSRLVRGYLMGERDTMNDLMAWNADATRMPYRMHSEYLRHLFLDNDLVGGRYEILGHKLALSDIRLPTFAVGAEADHVAPWRSTYKINVQVDADVTFLLTSGGHNAGIISEPGHAGRHYRIARRARGDMYVDPDSWLAKTPAADGSWWPAWADWLEKPSEGKVAPPSMGAPAKGLPPLEPAPGRYVLQP